MSATHQPQDNSKHWIETHRLEKGPERKGGGPSGALSFKGLRPPPISL